MLRLLAHRVMVLRDLHQSAHTEAYARSLRHSVLVDACSWLPIALRRNAVVAKVVSGVLVFLVPGRLRLGVDFHESVIPGPPLAIHILRFNLDHPSALRRSSIVI